MDYEIEDFHRVEEEDFIKMQKNHLKLSEALTQIQKEMKILRSGRWLSEQGPSINRINLIIEKCLTS